MTVIMLIIKLDLSSQYASTPTGRVLASLRATRAVNIIMIFVYIAICTSCIRMCIAGKAALKRTHIHNICLLARMHAAQTGKSANISPSPEKIPTTRVTTMKQFCNIFAQTPAANL